jgi:hypothetical protein
MCPTTPHTNPSQGNPMGKCTKNQVITSVGRFSNADPVLYPVSSRFSTLLNVKTEIKTVSGSHTTEKRL